MIMNSWISLPYNLNVSIGTGCPVEAAFIEL